MEQVTHTVHGVTITRDTLNTAGHASEQPAVTERLDWTVSKGPFQPHGTMFVPYNWKYNS